MKAGYIAPMSIAAVNGGLRTQAEFTAKHIRDFGVEPLLLSPWDNLQSLKLDLVHVFGASSENVGIMKQVKSLGIPLVLSTVLYSNRSASTIRKVLKLEKFTSKLLRGFRSEFGMKADLCNMADLNLPNTPDEARLIEKAFSISPKKIQMIPNGVESRFQNATPELFIQKYGIQDFVLFAGHAGAKRKNVLKLLEAAPKIHAPIVIIGTLPATEYGLKCRKLAEKSGNVLLIDTLEHHSKLLASAYAACKVFVLPSQFETPGIAAMEAALANSNIVITNRGGTKSYFGGLAEYVDPDSTDSIILGIRKALLKQPTVDLKKHILNYYTWEKVAEQTVNQYKKLVR